MAYKNFAYLAGPWFSPRQSEILEQTKITLDSIPISYYSPKDEMLFTPGGPTDPMEVLRSNVDAIKYAEIFVCITDGKDTGTMFEAGYAYGLNKPIFYLWIDREPGQKFNLMLGASGTACMAYEELSGAIEEYLISGDVLPIVMREDITYE